MQSIARTFWSTGATFSIPTLMYHQATVASAFAYNVCKESPRATLRSRRVITSTIRSWAFDNMGHAYDYNFWCVRPCSTRWRFVFNSPPTGIRHNSSGKK